MMNVRSKNIHFILIILVTIFLVGCSQKGAVKSDEITVFAAASLTECFTDIANAFEQEKGTKVILNFAGSQALTFSIKEGAQADVFASANEKYLADLIGDEHISDSYIFAKNSLVVCKSKNTDIEISELEDLAQEDIIIVAGHEAVPVGKYFYKSLDNAIDGKVITPEKHFNIIKNIKSYEMNVKDVVSKVLINEADLGIVYRTDINDNIADELDMIEIDAFNRVNIQYPIGTLNKSLNEEKANRFIQFVLSEKGKEILDKHGFIVE